jgi:hypothetical protein
MKDLNCGKTPTKGDEPMCLHSEHKPEVWYDCDKQGHESGCFMTKCPDCGDKLYRDCEIEEPDVIGEKTRESYFNDFLSNHVGHAVYICEYTCGVCGKTSDYMLRCGQEEVDGTCFDDPVGIAREVVNECGCSLADSNALAKIRKNLSAPAQCKECKGSGEITELDSDCHCCKGLGSNCKCTE